MSNRSVSAATRLGSAILLCALACAAAQARQTGTRVISPAPVEAGRQTPVEVVSVSVGGKPVEPGRPFEAGDDWLLGLTFRVKNVSDRPGMFVDISLRIPAEAGRKHRTVSFVGPVRYGCWPDFPPCFTDAAGSSAEIKPGETGEVSLKGTPEWFAMLPARLGAATPVVSAEYDIDLVFFDAETQWSRGLLFRRDPSQPDSYRMQGKYVLPKKN